jgi:hypothetical protein
LSVQTNASAIPFDCGLLPGVVRGTRPMSRAKAGVVAGGVAGAVVAQPLDRLRHAVHSKRSFSTLLSPIDVSGVWMGGFPRPGRELVDAASEVTVSGKVVAERLAPFLDVLGMRYRAIKL